MTKITSLRRASSGACNLLSDTDRGASFPDAVSLGCLGDFVDHHFFEFTQLHTDREPPFYNSLGFNKLFEAKLSADIFIYAYGSQQELDEFNNRGTPVIVVDEGNSPCISPELLALLNRPEVRLCFRKYGFRDPAAYFRGGDYYRDAYAAAVTHDTPPEHFPIYDDDPMGNAIRKIQVCFPVVGDVAPFYLGGLGRDVSPLESRDTDVLFVNMPEDPRTEGLERIWEDVPGDHKVWLDYKDIYPLHIEAAIVAQMRAARIFISTGLFTRYDFYAVLCGCVVVKPECSNVRSHIDIFDPLKSYIQYCDVGFKDLLPILSYILGDIGEYQTPTADIMELFGSSPTHDWAAHLRRMCQDILNGRSRLGDVKDPLPLVYTHD